MFWTYILFFLGFAVLIFGADKLVDGAISLGIKAKIPTLVIGLTIVALGTSLPELIINIFASINNNSGLAIGNIIGSNIVNIMLILGLTAIIYPVDVDRISIRRDIPTGFIVTVLLLLLANDFTLGESPKALSWIDGTVLMLCFGLYIFITLRTSKPSFEADTSKEMSLCKSVLLVIFGCTALYIGGELVSDNATEIARSLGMSDEVIGLTIISIVTSLPELITSIVAAVKKDVGIVIGNIVGSNIINILIVLGISSIINPISYTFGLGFEPMVLLLANFLLVLFTFTGKGLRISRFEGSLLVLVYIAFITMSVVR